MESQMEYMLENEKYQYNVLNYLRKHLKIDCDNDRLEVVMEI